MASESIVSQSHGISTPEDKQTNDKLIDQSESRNDSERGCDETTSGDDDWSDDFEKLVIDLGNDNDPEKSSKETKPSGRNTPISNINNNNSVNSSPSKHGGSLHDKSCSKTKSSLSRNSSPVSSKSSKNKTKKSSKPSSSKHHQNAGSPSGSSGEIVGNPTTSSSSKQTHSADSKTLAPTSPEEGSSKKNKSSKNRSHKKHKEKGQDKGQSSNGKGDGEKSKSKQKHGSSANSNSAHSSAGFPQAAGSHFLPPHVAPVPAASHAQASKQSSARRSASPSVTNQPTVASVASKSHQTQGRQPSRTAVMPTSSLGVKASSQQATISDKDHNIEQTSGQSSRKKHRKGPHGQATTQTNACGNSNDPTEQYSRVFAALNTPVQGKRERNTGGSTASHATAMDGSGPKKIKLDTDTKQRSKDGNNSARTSPDRNETARLVKTSSGGNIPPQNGAQIPATPPVFAPSSIFATSTISHFTGPLTQVGSSQTSSVWSRPSQQPATASTNTSSTMTSSRTVGTLTCTSDIGVMTEPDVLGPCEPGTNVHLDGIVWHETDTGVLVVNVTWRNRTYVGTLLDATKHDWAPPRFSDCDVDMELRGKNGRPKRLRNGANEATTRKGRSRGAVNDDIKGSPSSAAKKRGSKTSESEANEADGTTTPKTLSKRARLASSRNANSISQQLQQLQNDRNTNGSNGGSGSSTCSSPVFIECPHPKCSKKYRHANGLKYHQAHAHLDYDENDVKDDVTNHVDEGDERITDSESAPKRENPGNEDEKPGLTDQVAVEPGILQPVTPEAAAPSVPATSASDGFTKDQQMEVSPSPKTGSPPTSIEIPNKQDSAPSFQCRPNDIATSAADSENELAVKNLLKQLGDGDDQVLPGLTAPYSQDSPAPTLSLSRPEYAAPGGPYRDTSADYSFVPSSEAPRPAYYQKPSVSMTKQDTTVTLSGTSTFGKVPADIVASAATVPVMPPSGPSQPLHQLPMSVSIHSTESGHVSAGSIHYTSGEYPSAAMSHPSGVKTAKGKTVPIPVGSTQSLLPSGNMTSPTSAKKNKPRKKKMPGEGGESTVSVKQESSHSSVESAGSGSASIQYSSATSDVNTVTGAQERPQQPPRPPPQQEAMTLNTPVQGQTIKSEPGARYPQTFPQQHHVAPRRIQGVVAPASSSAVQSTHNVTVAGTFHPFPDPHKPQTAVSAQAQDRLRASRSHSPTNSSSSNRNNNNKPSGSRLEQSQQQLVKPRSQAPTEGGEPEGNYRGKYPDPKPRTSLDHHEHAFMKMQDKVVSTIANEYRLQTSRAKPPGVPVVEPQRHQESASVRSLSPPEVARHGEEPRPRQRVPSPARPRTKETPQSQRESESRLAKSSGDAQFATNPHALLAQMPHLYPSYPYFINPAAAAALETQAPYHYIRTMEFIQDYQKQQMAQQQQQAFQQQKASEVRPRKPAETVEKLIKPEPSKQVGPPSQTESAHEKTALWVANQAKRLSTGAISPFPNQPGKEKSPFQTPVHSQAPTHTRYKSPQPPHQPQHAPGPQQRSHSVAPVSVGPGGHRRTDSGDRSHKRSESGERPHRRSEVKEEARSTPIRKQSTPTQLREGKSPEKSKEMAGSMYRSTAESPGHLQYYATTPGGPYAPLYDPSRPAYRGVPYAVPGYVYPQTAPMYPAQPGWAPPGSQPPNHGKQSPPLKESKERPSSVPRSPKEDRPRVDPTDQHHSFTKERPREGPPSRKTSPSPDPKQSVNVGPNRIPTSNPGEQRIPSPPTQRHLHTHHHIHEGVPFNQFIPPPQHYPYPAAIAPPAVIAPNGETVAAAVYPPTAFNQKRD